MNPWKKFSLAAAALALLAAIPTLGPVQRAIAQGVQHLTSITGTIQITGIGYPCTVSCYLTTQDIATFVQSGAATGTVDVPHGGTGVATMTAHGVVVGEGTSPVAVTAVGATGTLLAGTTGADPAFTATPASVTSINGNAIRTNSAGTFLTTNATVSATTGLPLTPIKITDMRTATGILFAASASGTVPGITVTPGTQAVLVGTATSSSSTTNVAYFEYVLPPNYVAGTDLTVGISCVYINSSSTASVHTMTAQAYLENTTSGQHGSGLIASGAVTCPLTTATNQTVTLTGATLVPGSYVAFTMSWAVTNGAGASTQTLTGVTIN